MKLYRGYRTDAGWSEWGASETDVVGEQAMTDEEKLQHAISLDEAYARSEAFDRARWEEEDENRLDAYGHLEWTVGNEDWCACFDAIRTAEGIAFHVVVNCESGGWIDTVESGTVSVETAIEHLAGMPCQYADTCAEHYLDQPEMVPDYKEVMQCAESWRKHLEGLIAEPAPEPDEEPSDEYGELRKAALNHRGEP